MPKPPPSDVLDLKSTILMRLYDISSPMNDNSASSYKLACGLFFGHQFLITTPPVCNLECVVVGQEVEMLPLPL
jgi:hypothetical protein